MRESDPAGPFGPVEDPADEPGQAGQALADALRALRPAPARTSPRAVWYRAGVEAGRRRANRWRAVAAATTLVAGLAAAWGARPAPAPVDRFIYVREPAAAPAAPGVAAAGPVGAEAADDGGGWPAYARVCRAVAEHGPDALPKSGSSGGGGAAVPGWDWLARGGRLR